MKNTKTKILENFFYNFNFPNNFDVPTVQQFCANLSFLRSCLVYNSQQLVYKNSSTLFNACVLINFFPFLSQRQQQ